MDSANPTPPTQKQCNTCKKFKTTIEFSKHSQKRNGISNRCKECHNEYHRKYHKNNPNIVKPIALKAYKKNKEIILNPTQNNYNDNSNILKNKNSEFNSIPTQIIHDVCILIKKKNKPTKIEIPKVETERKCTKCGITKPIIEFNKNSQNKTGISPRCKECHNKYYRNYCKNNPELIKKLANRAYKKNFEANMKRKKVYLKENAEKIRQYEINYRILNREKANEWSKQWQKRNPEKNKQIVKKTYEKNKQKMLEYKKYKRATDPKYRIINRMRSGFKGWLNGKQKSCSVMSLISLSKDEFVIYLESKFSDDMKWENIHIDHYVPLSFFNPENKSDMVIAWNYRNLRPLYKTENISKNNTLPEDYLEHINKIKEALGMQQN